MKSAIATCLVAVAVAAAQSVLADELKVMTGGSMGGAFAELVPQFERASGHKLVVFYGGVPDMIKRTAAGEPFDVAIVPQQVLQNASIASKFAPGRCASAASAMGSPCARVHQSQTSPHPRHSKTHC